MLPEETEVLVELAVLILACTSFFDGEALGGGAVLEDVDEDAVAACSRAARRFCFPLSTPFLATVVWSLQARSN